MDYDMHPNTHSSPTIVLVRRSMTKVLCALHVSSKGDKIENKNLTEAYEPQMRVSTLD